MSEEQMGFTNIGTDGIQPIRIETKEPTLVPESVAKGLEQSKEGELKDSPEDFSKYVEKKKRGRPKKNAEEVKVLREFYCSTCRESISELNAMKIGAGNKRSALFCPFCQKSLGFLDLEAEERLAELHKNPSKK